MAADRGVTVHQVDIRPDDVTLDLEDLESKLGPRTRLVAVGYASNAVGLGQPGQGDRRAGARGRGADLRRRRGVRPARADRRPGARHGLPRDLGLQVVRAAHGRAVRQGRGRSTTCRRSRSGRRPIASRPGRSRSNRSPARWRRPTTCATSVASYGDVTAAPGAADASERRRELVAGDGRDRRLRARAGHPAHRRPRGASRASRSTASPTRRGSPPSASRPSRSPSMACTRTTPRRRSVATGIFVWDGDFYATGPHRGARQGRDRRRPAHRARPLQHRRRGRPDPRRRRGDRRGMTEAAGRPSIQARLARGFDPAELRRIKRLWVRHSIAEDRRDIDGLIATLAPDCVYEIVVTGPALGRARRRPGVLHGALRGLPGQRVRPQRDRRRAAGRVRGRDAHRHQPGAVGRGAGVGPRRSASRC